MRKITLSHTLSIVLIFGLFTTHALMAGEILVDGAGATKLKVNENSYSTLGLTNTLAGIDFMQVKTKEGYFTHFHINEYGYNMEEGSPKLPVLKKLISVPLGATCEVEILSSIMEEINLADYGIADPVMPSQPSVSKSIDNPEDLEFVINQAVYDADVYWGPEMVKVVDLGIFRGTRMARIEIAPVYYNPVKNILRVYSEIELRIDFNNANLGATMSERTNRFSPYYESIYNQLINNKSMAAGGQVTLDAPVTMIIVSDPMFEEALEPFVEWKTKKGFLVVEAYTDNPDVGNTTASIKNYLQNFYEDPPEGYTSQSFVLFVGDVAQIPAFSGTTGSHVTDLYYCTYDGEGDIYPDCYYGRFSANNLTELQPQIDKTLEYEQYLFPDPSFLDEVVMIAGKDNYYGPLYGNGQINYGTENYFNLAHGLTSHTYLQPEPTGGTYDQDIRGNISDGVGYANYTAHCNENGWGDPTFFISHIASLENEGKYPLMVGNCCLSAAFQTTCFGESLLRAENKGALGYIGGSNNTLWDEDFWWGVGFESVSVNPSYNSEHLGAYDRLFHDNDEAQDEWYVTQGQMPSAGNLAVTQSGSSYETYYWEIYHLMGDPTVMIYFSQPSMATASYMEIMPLGIETFTVNTDPYAYVAISKEGVLHGCGYADDSGIAEVSLFNPVLTPGEADIVITGQNLGPFIGTVDVESPDGPYVLLNEVGIDDGNGNANGLIDFGENILLDVTLENFGQQPASAIVSNIFTDDEYITIDSASHEWPEIAAGGALTELAAFSFTVGDFVPDQHQVNFTLETVNGDETWTSTFFVSLNAPHLSVGSYQVDDTDGNANGRLDPGENADIIIPVYNDGGCDALNTLGSLLSTSPFLEINNSTYDIGTLASGENVNAVFNVTVDEMVEVGEIVAAVCNMSSGLYSASQDISMSIGLIIEDFESGDFQSFPWEFGGNADWTIDGGSVFEGEYGAKSGDIGDNSTSTLIITADVSTDDEISFSYRVSSESNYDYLRFYIDGTLKDEWSGEVPWSQASFDVTSGNHTFKWEYYKDYSVSNGSDCAWIDYIVFPPIAGVAPLGVIASADIDEICEGESVQLSSYAMGGSGNYSYAWTPETGLDDPAAANPIANPSVTTNYTVTVSDDDASVSDNVLITVYPLPEQPIITQSGSTLVSSATDGNQWYDPDGPIAGATGQTYTPSFTNDYYVIVSNSFGCQSVSETYYFTFTGIIELDAGQKVNLYPNPFNQHFVLDYSLPNTSEVKISFFNSYGQLLTVIEDEGTKTAGNYRITFNASRYEVGIYFLKVETADYSVIKRVIRSN